MTYKLNLLLQEPGYSFFEPASVVVTPTRGGFARRAADLEDASLIVNATWQCTEAQYSFLLQFFSIGTRNGKDAFILDLIIDSAEPAEYTALFSSDGPKLVKVIALTYFVSDTLEVIPQPVDEDFDGAYVALYALGGGTEAGIDAICDSFSRILDDWPERA